jgi:serine/threonine protein kinase
MTGLRLTSEQWLRVRSLFEAVVDLDPRDANAIVAREAAEDSAVRAEVISLLQHHSGAGAFLSEPIAERIPELLSGEDEALASGTTIGTYTIERELGRGGMGRVYLARDARLGRSVALKALVPHLMRDPLPRERLRREARAAAALTHPGICTVYALEEIDGELFIASEFIDGETLGQEIRSGRRPSTRDVVGTARALAAALAAAHAAGIVHRDLKPDNVMRARDGQVKILDFGLARDVSGLSSVTLPGVLVGTPAYMAPEQIDGQPATVQSDVFAFGVLLYEYASGIHPFAGGTPLATAARVLENEARPIGAQCPEIPATLADVIARCLCKAPRDRFASAGELLAALNVVSASGRPSSARPMWWQMHQFVVVALYIVAAILAWQFKEWNETPVTVGIFIAAGALATIGGVLRGHLVFTERMNRAQLTTELLRATRATKVVDLMIAGLLVVDGVIVSTFRALPATFAISLGISIGLAVFVLEPATVRAVFGGEVN